MTAEGSVYQRKDGRWVAQYRDARGKMRYLYRKTKTEAKKALREALKDRDDNFVPADKMTVGMYFDEWMDERKNTVSARTWRGQESIIRCRVKPHIGPQRLCKLSGKVSYKLYRRLLSDGLSASTEQVSETIRSIVRTSEVDLGIGWQPPVFVRTGAPLLDEHLVNEPRRWLAEPKYKSVRQPFEKGLSHYLEAQDRPDRLADVITDMYEAVEALAKTVTGRTGKDLSGNAEQFISEVGASRHFKTLLRNYIAYGNEFRHAEREGRPRPPLSDPEVEAFIYMTGLFIP